MNREALEERITLARQQWAQAQQRQQAAYEERLRIEGYLAHCQELLAELGQGGGNPPCASRGELMAKKMKTKPAQKAEPVKDGPRCWMCGDVRELSPVTIMAAQRQVVSVCPRCRQSIESGDSDYLIAK